MKGIIALGFSGLMMVVDQIKDLPGIVRDLGIPVTFAACAIAGVYLIHRQCSDMTAGRLQDNERRIEDAQAYAERLERHIENGALSRAELIDISKRNMELTAEQLKAHAKTAIAIDRLTEKIETTCGIKR